MLFRNLDKHAVGMNREPFTTNRLLLLCSAPIYVYWMSMALTLLEIWFVKRPMHVAFAILSELLFLVSPLCVIVGWAVFARQRELYKDHSFVLGRNLLIVASVLAVPVPILTLACFVLYLQVAVELFR